MAVADLRIIDPHFHTWDLSTQQLQWLGSTPADFQKSYEFEELARFYRGCPGVDFAGGVIVEADVVDATHEARQMAELTESNDDILGYVAHASLSGDMDIPAEALGIREVLHNDDVSPGRCLEPSFIEGLELLAEAGKTFDAVVRTEDLPNLVRSLEQVPQVRVVLDHLGNAVEADGNLYAVFGDLAALPNTFCKVSGLTFSQPEAAEQIMDMGEATFGRSRLMYCSNWPVIDLYASLDQHLSAVRRHFGDDQEIFSETARRAYRLKGN